MQRAGPAGLLACRLVELELKQPRQEIAGIGHCRRHMIFGAGIELRLVAWDRMRLQYQGIVPPSPRSERNFDAGAKYHVPASVPYTRYFLARILQFQFYKAACDIAGWRGPLHRCTFYGNREVGRRLNAMLAMGASKPWPDALEAFTGSREMSAKPMLEYFAPLQRWLEEQNRGKQCGW